MTHPSKKSGLGNRIAPPRFVLFGVLFAVATAIAWWRLGWALGLMSGFDIAAGVFLVSVLPFLRHQTTETMRQHAAENDANRAILLVISAVLSAAVMAAVYGEVQGASAPNIPLIIGTLVLAWLFGNTIFALHYAHLYYLEGSKGGLDFSGDPDCPDYADFVYFAFTLGMTFQTSDTGVETRHLRTIVTAHSMIAFFFNIGILAFTINVLGGKGG